MDDLLRHCLREMSFDGDLGCPVERLRDFITDFYAQGTPQNTDDAFCALIWSLVVQQPTVIVGTVPEGITSQVWIAPQNSQKRKAKEKGQEIVQTAPPTLDIVPDAKTLSLDQLKDQYADQLRIATNPDTTYAALTGTHIRFPKMSPMVYTALQIITRGRETGVTVVELGQRSTYDQKTCFYLVKQLTELDLIVKVRRGGVGTHFCIHKYFFERSDLWRAIREEETRANAALEADDNPDVPEEDGEQPPPVLDLGFTPIDARHISSLPLLKGRVIRLLKVSKNQMHASNNMLIAIGFSHPTKTNRRFFTARMRELVEQRVVECVFVANKRRGSTTNGIKCYRLVSPDTAPPTPQGEVAAPSQPDDDPDEQSGVKFNTTIHKQILSLIEESGKTGMTLNELTNALSQFDRRTTELILTRAEKFHPPAHLMDLGIACLMETNGRERRNRYYTLASYQALVAQEGLDKTSAGYTDIDLAQVNGFYPFNADLFYSDAAALMTHQDRDMRLSTNPKGRKNPILPDGTVKKGRPRKTKADDDDDEKPRQKRKRKQAEGDEPAEEKKRPKKKARTDVEQAAPISDEIVVENGGPVPDASDAPAASPPNRRGRPPKKKKGDPPPDSTLVVDLTGEYGVADPKDVPVEPAPKRRGRPPKNGGKPPVAKKRGRGQKISPVDVDDNGEQAVAVGEADPQSDDVLPPAKRARILSPQPGSTPLTPLIPNLDEFPPATSSTLTSLTSSPNVPLQTELREDDEDLLAHPAIPLSDDAEMQVEPEEIRPQESAANPPVGRQQKVNVSTLRRDNELFRVLELLGGIANTQTKELFDVHMSLLTTLAEAGEPASAPPGTSMDRRTAIAAYNSLEAKGRVKQFKTTLTTVTGLVRPANIVYLPQITEEQISVFLLEQGRNTVPFTPVNISNQIIVEAHTEYGAKVPRRSVKTAAAQLMLGSGSGKGRMPNAQRADQLFAMNEETIREALLTERTTFGQVYGYIPSKMLRARELHRYCLSVFLNGRYSPGIVSHPERLASFTFFYSEIPLGLYCAIVACVDGSAELSQWLATDQGWNMPVKDLPPNLHTLLQISRTRGRGRILELLDILRSLGLAEPLTVAADPEVASVTCPANGEFPTTFKEDTSEAWSSDKTMTAPAYWRFTTAAPVFYWHESQSDPAILAEHIACLGSKEPPQSTSDIPPLYSVLVRAKRKAKTLRRRVSWAEGYSFTWHQSHYIRRRMAGVQGLPALDGSDAQLLHVASVISAPVDVVRAFYEKAVAAGALELEKATRRIKRSKDVDAATKASLAKKGAEALAVREAKWEALVAKVHPDPLPEESNIRLKRVRTLYLQSTGAQVGKWQREIAQALHDTSLATAPNSLTQRKRHQWQLKPSLVQADVQSSSHLMVAHPPAQPPPVVANPPEKTIASLIAAQGPAIVEKTRSRKKRQQEPEPEPEPPSVNTGPRSRFHWNKDYEELLKDAYVIVDSRCRTRGKIDWGMVKQVFPGVPRATLRSHMRTLRGIHPAMATYLSRLEDHWHQLWVRYRGSTWLPDDNTMSLTFDLVLHIEFLRKHVDKNAIRVGFAEEEARIKNVIPASVDMLFDQFDVVEQTSGTPAWEFMWSGLVDDNREKRALRQALTTRPDDLTFGTEQLNDEIILAESALKLTMGTASQSYNPAEAARLLHEIGESTVQAAQRNLLGRGVLSKAFRNPNSRPGRMLKISEINSNAIGGSIPRDTFNDALALEDISTNDDSWREWPLLATDGDTAALLQLVSDNKVHFKIDTTQPQTAREFVDWNSKKADDDHIETAIFVRFHDISDPQTPSPIQTPGLESMPIETVAEHGTTVDGTPACCKRLNEDSLIDCPACLEEEWATLYESLDTNDRDIFQLILDVVTACGKGGISKSELLEKTGLPREAIRLAVRRMTECGVPPLFWAGYSSLVLVASVYLRAWSVVISAVPMMRMFPRRWVDMTGSRVVDHWEAATRAVMGVLVFHPGLTQTQLRWRLRSVYDRQEIYEILQSLCEGGFVEVRGGTLPADDDEESEVCIFLGERRWYRYQS
ncbi:hypothetical protein C8F01DRAFT_1110582 [Mycena amicta]|nr:hypothetical protein C8F01DRAFT_1110582 [Mycena amicta]